MRTTPAARRSAVAVAGAVLATAGLSATALPARAALCAGDTSWTGSAADGLWTTAGNWTAGVPDSTLRAVVPAGTTVAGLSGQACGLALTGGDASTPTSVSGDLEVLGLLDLQGALHDDAHLVAGSLAAASGTDLLLGTDLVVRGPATLAAGSLLRSTVSPVLDVTGTLTATGDALLSGVGLRLAPTGTVDLQGHTLTVSGPSSLPAGSTVTDTTAAGTLVLSGPVATAGTVTVAAPARLQLAAGAALTATSPTTLTGGGALAWSGGTVAGDLTTQLPTTVDGTAAKRLLGAGSALRVPTGQQLTVTGPVTVDGQLAVAGVLALAPGATLSGGTATAQVTSPSGSSVAVPLAGAGAASTPAVLDGVGLVSAGTVTVAPGEDLVLSAPNGLTGSSLADGTQVRGGGSLQVATGSRLDLTGTVHLVESTTVALREAKQDAPTDGSGAQLVAHDATLAGTAPTTDAPSPTGTLQWDGGQVLGRLTVTAVKAVVGSLSTSTGSGTRALLPGPDGGRGRLSLQGPVSLQAARVTLHPQTDVLLAGAISFGAAAGFTALDPAAAPDATVTVTPTGSVSAAPVSFSGLTLPSAALFDVPVVNQGAVTLDQSSLSASAGYRQQQPAGSTVVPSTAVYTAPPASDGTAASPATLSAGTSTVTIEAGGLYGKGTVKAATVTMAGGFLLPGFGTEAATLRVEGDLHLTDASDVQLLVAGTTPATQAQLQVTGTAVLAGRVTGLTATGTTPTYGQVAASMLTAGALSGRFTKTSWSPSPNGLGWQPAYDVSTGDGDGVAVDLRFADVSPPALGIAGVPAFTPLARQRITYAGVDNKTGVASYDVRVRRSTPTSVGGWSYPAAWQATRSTSVDSTGLLAGSTYCWSVRARDKAGNTTPWSQPFCSTRLADDRAWSASSGWSRPGGVSGFSSGTVSRTTRAGATLRGTGTYTRVAVTLLHCPTCGVVDVLSGSTRLARVDLRASGSSLQTWTSKVLTSRTAPVTVRVVTSGRTVLVDAVALQRY